MKNDWYRSTIMVHGKSRILYFGTGLPTATNFMDAGRAAVELLEGSAIIVVEKVHGRRIDNAGDPLITEIFRNGALMAVKNHTKEE